MKKLLLIIGLLLLSHQAHAAISFVQATSTPSANGVTYKTTATTTTAGDLLIIGVQYVGSGQTTTVGDSQGNVYTLATTSTNSNAGTSTFAVYYLLNAPGGSLIASTTHSGASSVGRIFFHEYSGVARTNALDAFIASSTTVTNTLVNTGRLTTQGLNELFFMLTGSGNVATYTFLNGFTQREAAGRGSTGDLIAASSTVSGFATINANMFWDTIMVAFLPPPTPPSPTAYLDLEVGAFINGFLSI